jgi:flagellar basal body-associated protein FliL
MKMMSEWLETVIENVSQPRSTSVFLLVLIVLILGAGSLYMLLNTHA